MSDNPSNGQQDFGTTPTADGQGRTNLLLDLLLDMAAADSVASLLSVVQSQLSWIVNYSQSWVAVRRADDADLEFHSGDAFEHEEAGELPEHVALRETTDSGRVDQRSRNGDNQVDLLLPIQLGTRRIGALLLRSAHARGFDRNDIHFARTAVTFLALAVDRQNRIEAAGRASEQISRQRDELAAANNALEQSNFDLQQFAYVASHDLQTPLRSIAGFAQFLREDFADSLDGEAAEYIDHIINGATRMQSLIRDLLTYSRVETQAKPFAETDLNEIVDEVRDLIATDYPAASCVTRDDLPTVHGDASQLLQLLQNLIGNGLKYCNSETPQVHVAARSEPEEWIVSVRDNGIGIEEKHFDRIFEIFSRLHNQREYSGTGIGLAICRRVIQQHNGRLWVDSQPNAGSTFHFSLPKNGFD